MGVGNKKRGKLRDVINKVGKDWKLLEHALFRLSKYLKIFFLPYHTRKQERRKKFQTELENYFPERKCDSL